MIHVLYNPIAGGGTGEIRARELEKRFPGEKMVFRDVRPTNLTVLTRSLAPGDRVILAFYAGQVIVGEAQLYQAE